MKTWAQVQAFIDKHSLPYRITHWNLSMRGCLIDEYNGRAVFREGCGQMAQGVNAP